MKITQKFLGLTLLFCASIATVRAQEAKGLKEYYQDYFPIGVAVNLRSLVGPQAEFIKYNFSSITAENDMKMGPLQPKEGVFNWVNADKIVDFATKNNLKIRGHVLCWHEQAGDWIFVDNDGKNVSREVLLDRLRTHIHTVVNRYKGKVYAWDVVNEAIDDNPNNLLRNSKWKEIIGEDFVEKAFEYAHEADPNAKLFYNDYNSVMPEKAARIYTLLKRLKEKNIPIHGVGLQGHWSIFGPSREELESAIERYASLGLEIHITELDVSVYPWEKERRKKRPEESDEFTPQLQQEQADKYQMFFEVFRKYKNHITSVTFWNATDRYTWLDYFPVHGRKNYPSLFDIEAKPKPAFWKVVDF